jgi:hypothetical protein
MKKKVRIVIEFDGDYARSWASSTLPRIQQAVMHRNPLEEPWVRCEVSNDSGKTWERDDSV